MLKIVLIAAGGALGTLLRYYLGMGVQAWAGPRFPVSTVAINVTGCFAIGLLAVLLAPGAVRPEVRLAVLVGVLGGYTTFSTFGYETLQLANAGQFWGAGLNVLLSNGAGLLAVWMGYRLGVWWHGVT